MYTFVPIFCRETVSATAEEKAVDRFKIVVEFDSTF